MQRSGGRFETIDEQSCRARSKRIRSAEDKSEMVALTTEAELSSQNALTAEFEFERELSSLGRAGRSWMTIGSKSTRGPSKAGETREVTSTLSSKVGAAVIWEEVRGTRTVGPTLRKDSLSSPSWRRTWCSRLRSLCLATASAKADTSGINSNAAARYSAKAVDVRSRHC